MEEIANPFTEDEEEIQESWQSTLNFIETFIIALVYMKIWIYYYLSVHEKMSPK